MTLKGNCILLEFQIQGSPGLLLGCLNFHTTQYISVFVIMINLVDAALMRQSITDLRSCTSTAGMKSLVEEIWAHKSIRPRIYHLQQLWISSVAALRHQHGMN